MRILPPLRYITTTKPLIVGPLGGPTYILRGLEPVFKFKYERRVKKPNKQFFGE